MSLPGIRRPIPSSPTTVTNEWLFYVVRSETLPEGQNSIGLNGIEQLAEPVNIDDLATVVQSMMNS